MDTKTYNLSEKWTGLICVLHNSFVVLFIRYTLIQGGPRYFSSTAVVMGELFKIFVCLFMIFCEGDYSLKLLKADIVSHPLTGLKLAIPAFLYSIYNNILYYGLSNLEVPVYQVTNQLKIFSTAIFFSILLKHKLPFAKWLSLALLFLGTSIVQLQASEYSTSETSQGNVWLGIAAVSSGAVLSGFAGVYFEKIMKSVQTPMWILNFYLAVFGFIFSLLVTFVNDYNVICEQGFFYGWNLTVVVLVINQAAGGLIISFIVKLANTIVKGFISALSIISSTVFSIYFFGFKVSWWFVVGTLFVCSGIYMYQLPDLYWSKLNHKPIPDTNNNNKSFISKRKLTNKIDSRGIIVTCRKV